MKHTYIIGSFVGFLVLAGFLVASPTFAATLSEEVESLRAQVAELKALLDAQSSGGAPASFPVQSNTATPPSKAEDMLIMPTTILTVTQSVLKPGTKSDDVKVLQSALLDKGLYKGTIDGSYGPGTKGAVMAFQTANNLTSDGIAGKLTMGALGITVGSPEVPTPVPVPPVVPVPTPLPPEVPEDGCKIGNPRIEILSLKVDGVAAGRTLRDNEELEISWRPCAVDQIVGSQQPTFTTYVVNADTNAIYWAGSVTPNSPIDGGVFGSTLSMPVTWPLTNPVTHVKSSDYKIVVSSNWSGQIEPGVSREFLYDN